MHFFSLYPYMHNYVYLRTEASFWFSLEVWLTGKKKSYIVLSFDLNLQDNLEQTVTTPSTQLEKAQRMTNSLSFHPACLNSLIFAFVAFVTYLVSLMDKVGLQKNSCKIIDVTNKRGTVETLTEAKISCAIEEVCNSWANKEAKLFKIQDTIFITFYCWFEPNASTCTPHCLGNMIHGTTEVYQVKSKENYETYSCCKNHLIQIYFEFSF